MAFTRPKCTVCRLIAQQLNSYSMCERVKTLELFLWLSLSFNELFKRKVLSIMAELTAQSPVREALLIKYDDSSV